MTSATPPPCLGRPDVAYPSSAAGEVTAARADAIKRARVADCDVRVSEVVTVTWPDGSLGCPKPGVMYVQHVVAGHRIRLQAVARTLEYHTAPGVTVYCFG